MNNALLYIAACATLYAFYKALPGRLSFFALNRVYLLTLPLFSVVAVFVLPDLFRNPFSQNIIAWQLPTLELEGNSVGKETSPGFWLFRPIGIYLAGVALSLLYHLYGFSRLGLLLRRSSPGRFRGMKIYYSTEISGAFCFAGKIVVPAGLRRHEDLAWIVAHEDLHRRKGHSVDHILFALLQIFTWFNPLQPLLKKELKLIHEYDVDDAISASYNPEDYAHTLLRSTLGGAVDLPVRQLSSALFINPSLLKRRIKMMYSRKTPIWQRISYLGAIPIMALIMAVACSKNDDSASPENENSKALQLNEVEQFPLADNCDAENAQECFQKTVFEHVQNNFAYPEELKELGMEGKVYVEFVINENGHVSQTRIVRGLTAETPEEEKAVAVADDYVVELVQSMPRFEEPAKLEGKAVAIKMTLPIQFKLS